MGELKKPCIKCLLSEIDREGVYASLRRYLESIDESRRIENDIYEKRLDICRQCEWLREGVCGKCGCFVEARAYKRTGYCPHESRKW